MFFPLLPHVKDRRRSSVLFGARSEGYSNSAVEKLWIKHPLLWIVGALSATVCARTMKEQVLAVPANLVWDTVPYLEKGLIIDRAENVATIVARHGVFMDRATAETDPGHKQIIPYAIVRHLDSYFLLQRKSAQSEHRLHNKFSLGVGGHINPAEGVRRGELIRDGLTREINEELHINTEYDERFIGLINDDTTDVGRVHLGILFEVDAASPSVSVRETHKMDGAWVLRGILDERYAGLESWSQIVYDSYVRNDSCKRSARPTNGHRDLRVGHCS
jgi:predicted NUDIX family phosphoesterase